MNNFVEKSRFNLNPVTSYFLFLVKTFPQPKKKKKDYQNSKLSRISTEFSMISELKETPRRTPNISNLLVYWHEKQTKIILPFLLSLSLSLSY